MQALANPERFMRWSSWGAPLAAGLAAGLFAIALPWALSWSPPDRLHNEMVRIMYVHVPAAWWALGIYVMMGIASIVSLVWRHTLADIAARAAAPIGAAYAGLCWVTGALWGARAWGAWWEWGMDGRLIAMLILFITYLGYMAIWAAVEDEQKAARLAAIVCIAGLINLPIVHWSVEIWPSLHQKASLLRSGGSSIHPTMLAPLLTMAAAYAALFAALLLAGMRTAIYRRRAEVARMRRASAA